MSSTKNIFYSMKNLQYEKLCGNSLHTNSDGHKQAFKIYTYFNTSFSFSLEEPN